MSLFVRSVNTLIYLFIEILALLLWNYIKPRLFISKSEHRYFVLALEQKVIFFFPVLRIALRKKYLPIT